MKGLTHFMTGVAAASCFPAAVEAGSRGNPLYFILGGVFGILPDTIDFKFLRFFQRRDIEITPDPNKPDAAMIAQGVAHAIRSAHASGRTIYVKLNTVPVGPDAWQQYRLRFDVSTRRVMVRYGPVVSTGQMPMGNPPEGELQAEALFDCPLALAYEAETTVDIFDGPMFAMTPRPDGTVRPEFIPWHRQGSHSIVTGVLLGLAGVALLDVVAGLVILAAFLAHVLADQLGFMGSSLLFPFVRRRMSGLQLVHSGDALANFSVVWLSCIVVCWNLYCQADPGGSTITLAQWVIFGVAVPFALLRLLLWWLRKGRPGNGLLQA